MNRQQQSGGGGLVVLVVALVWLHAHGAFAFVPRHHQAPAEARVATPPLVLPGSAAKLPPSRIYRYARAASFDPDESVIATAVALAESAGRPRAHNPTPPDDSYCLLQVNMLGDLGPARRAAYGLRRNEDLYDPATCMRVAYGISDGGTDWSPWTTYTRGTYRRFLPAAQLAREGEVIPAELARR